MRLLDRAAWGILGALCVVTIVAVSGAVEGGDLDPPGAPASTDSVRLPGTPISSLPYPISEPGHYYVTRNLTQPSSSFAHGIAISASNVTLDLGGFTLAGNTEAAAGIVVTGTRSNIVVRNGIVSGWGDLNLTDGGVNLFNATNAVVEDLLVTNNLGAGLRIGGQSVVSAVIAKGNSGDGINGGGSNVITDSQAFGNMGDGIQVTNNNRLLNNVVGTNAGDGINANLNNILRGNQSFRTSSGDGIEVGSQNLLTGNSAYGETVLGYFGIRTNGTSNVIDGNYTYFNQTGVRLDNVNGGNKVIRHVSTGDTTNYSTLSASDFIAPEQPIASATNPFANEGD